MNFYFLCQEIDGDMYDKIQEAYLLYAQIEADNANTVKAEFEDLRDQAVLVCAYSALITCKLLKCQGAITMYNYILITYYVIEALMCHELLNIVWLLF